MKRILLLTLCFAMPVCEAGFKDSLKAKTKALTNLLFMRDGKVSAMKLLTHALLGYNFYRSISKQRLSEGFLKENDLFANISTFKKVPVFSRLATLGESLQGFLPAAAKELGVPVPPIVPYDSKGDVNFDASLFQSEDSSAGPLVKCSSLLLTKLKPESSKALLCHELAHLRNGDLDRLRSLSLFGVVGAYVAQILLWKYVDVERKPQGRREWLRRKVADFGIMPLNFGFSLFIRYMQRLSEYRADHCAADVVGSAAMIHGLQDVVATRSNLLGSILCNNEEQQARYIPLIFCTHPSLASRVAVLEELNLPAKATLPSASGSDLSGPAARVGMVLNLPATSRFNPRLHAN